MRRILACIAVFALSVTSFVSSVEAAPTYSSLQWNLRQTHVFAAWHYASDRGAHAIVCDVDTGLAPGLADLAGSVIGGTNTVDPKLPDDYTDGNAHGTFTASEIVANGSNIWGVAPRAKLLVAKVLGDDGSGRYGGVTAGVLWCTSHGAQVVNMSLGGPSAAYDGMADAIKFGCDHGVDFAVAAGNDSADGSTTASDPASIESPCLIAVGATDRNKHLASYSNYRENSRSMVAPGSNIIGDFANGSAGFDSGTSMAAPEVAGEIALLRSMGANQYAAVQYALLTATPLHQFGDKLIDSVFFGDGLMNAGAACRLYASAHR